MLTEHARRRCAEMEISTKVAKRIVQHADVVYPTHDANGEALIFLWQEEPAYAVCGIEQDGNVLVLTVLFHTPDAYDRAGAAYTIKEPHVLPAA